MLGLTDQAVVPVEVECHPADQAVVTVEVACHPADQAVVTVEVACHPAGQTVCHWGYQTQLLQGQLH